MPSKDSSRLFVLCMQICMWCNRSPGHGVYTRERNRYFESFIRARVEHTDGRIWTQEKRHQQENVLCEQRQKTSKLHLAILQLFFPLSVCRVACLSLRSDINAFITYSSFVHCSIKLPSIHEILIVCAAFPSIPSYIANRKKKRYFEWANERKIKFLLWLEKSILFICISR